MNQQSSFVGPRRLADESDLPPTVRGRWVALAILAFGYGLNYIDRQMLALLIEPIRREIHLSDLQIGLLTGTLFGVVYSIMTLPIAAHADRANRVGIISIGCALWSVFTGLTGFAGTFLQLALARVGLAFGEAGGVAPSLSILGDYFPPRQRVLAISLYASAPQIGALVGTVAGGGLAAAFGWRVAFFTLSVIGVVVALLIRTVVAEPVRGRFDGGPRVQERRTSFVETLDLFRKLPSLAWLLVSVGLYSAAGNALMTWTPALLMRDYHASLHLVATFYGPVVGLSSIAGVLASGLLVSLLAKRSVRSHLLAPAASMMICAPVLALALSAPTLNSVLLMVALPIALINGALAPALALVQELTPADARSKATAILVLVLNFVGLGAGPLIIGVCSDLIRSRVGAASLHDAMILILPPLVALCAVTLYVSSRYVVEDHARVNRPLGQAR